ncbi:hypothetical protein IJT93_12475 [bacterium]|nr:hypothetical protein [bacterium]
MPSLSFLAAGYKSGDRIIFVKDWDPHFAADDPFYIDPVPKDSRGTVVNVGPDRVKVKMDDEATWPKPITLRAEANISFCPPEDTDYIRKAL